MRPADDAKPATKADWQTEDLPAASTTIRLDRRFDARELEQIRFGSIPEEMEDKWFLYWQDNTLFFHRSWTGNCLYIVRFEADGEGACMVEADVNCDPEQYRYGGDEYEAAMISYLIDRLLLDRDAEFPHAPDDDEANPLQQWSMVGRAMLKDDSETPDDGDENAAGSTA